MRKLSLGGGTLLIIVVALASACGGRAVATGSPDGTSPDSTSPTAPANPATPTTPSGSTSSGSPLIPNPGIGTPRPPGACANFTLAAFPTSIEEAQQAVTGRWSICGRGFPPPPAGLADAMGLELAGTTAYFLVRDQEGRLVRGAPDHERGLRMIDESGHFAFCLDDGGAQCFDFDFSAPAGRLHLFLSGWEIDLQSEP